MSDCTATQLYVLLRSVADYSSTCVVSNGHRDPTALASQATSL